MTFFSQGILRAALVVASIVLAATQALSQGRIEVKATPIDHFDNRDHELRRFGRLEFRGGLELRSSTKEFGGISALRVQPDGGHFIALSDRGHWLRGRIVYARSAPAGIADAEMAPMLSTDGRPLTARGWYDTESLADDSGTLYVGIEGVHRIVKFNYGKDGLRARGAPIPVPAEFKSFPSNQGLEALAMVPKGQPLAGALVAITELALDPAGNIKGFLLGGPTPGAFSVKRSDEFSVTDCAFLPGGDLLILERRFSWLRGAAVRIRRFAAADLKPGAVLVGDELLFADVRQQVDNYEALAVHRTAAGETVLTLMSDDNFSPLQRTLLMQFTLLE